MAEKYHVRTFLDSFKNVEKKEVSEQMKKNENFLLDKLFCVREKFLH